MPLFARNGNGPDGQQRARSSDDDGEQPQPDEHTRLLPNRVDSGRGMLAPDDPAVTPYNLWSIRVLRYLTLFFAVLTFAWWTVLLVSAFATPPGLHTRGSGFFAFSYASLALANMFFTLIFFGVPSKIVRILAIVLAFLLLLDAILLLSVQQTRYEEGWVGIVSVVWALLMSLWTLLTDRTVQWGKAEEEQRLTGRAESRRTLTEWTAVMVSTVVYVIMAIAVVLMTLTIILRALDAAVAPPGKLYPVDGGKYRLHVYCHGGSGGGGDKDGNKDGDKDRAEDDFAFRHSSRDGSGDGSELPTVLFEGGERPVEQHLWSFAENAVKNGSISRYCFVDRPGFAWSDTAPSPLSAGFAVDAVSEALAHAGEKGPWVLASAGIGSIYSRVFSARHGRDVKGLMLVDALHEDLLGGVASAGRGFLLWLRGVISPLGLDRLPGAIFRGRTSRDRLYGRAAHQGGKLIFARLQENLVAASFTKRDVQSSRQVQDKNTPLVVISSGKKIKASDEWEEKQRDLTTLTDKLKHWDIVDDAPHQVWETLEGRQKMENRLRQLVHA